MTQGIDANGAAARAWRTRRRMFELLAERTRTQTPVPSPCQNVCRIDVACGWCEGCLRTLDEVADWSILDDAEKRAVWARLAERCARLAEARLAAGAVPIAGPST